MKFPEDVRKQLSRRFERQHREWLCSEAALDRGEASCRPLEISLGIPSEQEALAQLDVVRAWVAAWQVWRGSGTLVWNERHWRRLGAQKLPEKLILDSAAQVALYVGESERWERVRARFVELVRCWPPLRGELPRHLHALAEYNETDFNRLTGLLHWIVDHPESHLYPRQLPISGIDSKWLEGHKGLLTSLVAKLKNQANGERDFYEICGLRPLPQLLRMRLLDKELRKCAGGLGDITAPWEQLAALNLFPATVFVVENLQTGLAFEEFPGAVVLMGLGYGVNVLGCLPWLAEAQSVYWGDLDTWLCHPQPGQDVSTRAGIHADGRENLAAMQGAVGRRNGPAHG